jgi:integrase
VGKHQINRLTTVAVKAQKKPGLYPDGGCLYLKVAEGGSKSWIFRFARAGRERQMGLGSLLTVTLAEAREDAKRCRLLLRDGHDPIAHREAERAKLDAAQAAVRTFKQCAIECHRLREAGWKNRKHAAQWLNTLEDYAYPHFGEKDVSAVDAADILAALRPIWIDKHATAIRLRGRIRMVIEWAAAAKYRRGHDPSIWQEVTSNLQSRRRVRKNFAACPHPDVSAIIAAIRNTASEDAAKLALEFTILTAARSGEVRLAPPSEVDLSRQRWNIPGERMKMGRPHSVPLSPRALEIIEQVMPRAEKTGYLFTNKKGKPYSDMTLTQILRRLGFDFTVHGFRSTFRDWCAEMTNYPREVCEAALAHSKKDQVEAAYFRSDLFDRRRELMKSWAEYCTAERAQAQVLSIGEKPHIQGAV